MPAKIDIPLVFQAAEGILKHELERFASAVYKYTQDAALTFEAKPSISKIYESGTIAASFDVILRVKPRDGVTVTVQLPRVDPRNGGKRCIIQRLNTLGAIVLSPIDCTVNTYALLQLTNMPGYVDVRFDGENYIANHHGCVSWGGGL